MGTEATRPTGGSKQQQRAEQEGRAWEDLAVLFKEGVQQCWSWHWPLGSLLRWWPTPWGSYNWKWEFLIFDMFKGTGEAPGLLREAGLLRRLREGGCSVTDHGNLVWLVSLAGVYNSLLQQVGSRGGPEEVLEFSRRTAAQVKAILAQGQVFWRTMNLMHGVL